MHGSGSSGRRASGNMLNLLAFTSYRDLLLPVDSGASSPALERLPWHQALHELKQSILNVLCATSDAFLLELGGLFVGPGQRTCRYSKSEASIIDI
jgi:hypothetical protein